MLELRNEFFKPIGVKLERRGDIQWVVDFVPNSLERKRNLLPRGFIYRLMLISEGLKDGVKLKPYALLAYTIRKKELRSHFADWLNIMSSYNFLKNLKPALWLLDLMGRKNKEEVLK